MRLDEITNKQKLDEGPVMDFLLYGLQIGTSLYVSWYITKFIRKVYQLHRFFADSAHAAVALEKDLAEKGITLTKEQKQQLIRAMTDPEYAAAMAREAEKQIFQLAAKKLNETLVKIETVFPEQQQQELLPLINDAKRAVMEKDIEKLVTVEQLMRVVDRFAPR